MCGDGLTPRAVKSLVAMGIDVSEEAGWLRNKGLRVIGGGLRLELPWPELSSYPGYGLVRTRASLDEMLARRAQAAGAKLIEGANVTGPLLDDDGQIIGVTVEAEGAEKSNSTDSDVERPVAPPQTFRARVVVAADGNSSRLSVAMGLRKRDDRPLGVAVRPYYTSPRHDDDYLESWLDLWDGDQSAARLRLDLRHGRRHLQRRARAAEHLDRVRQHRLPGAADAVAALDARGVGLRRGERGPSRCAAPRSRWASTARRTTTGGCCSPATRPAW